MDNVLAANFWPEEILISNVRKADEWDWHVG